MKRTDDHGGALAAFNDGYHTILNSLKNIIIILDKKHRIVEFNREAENLYGRKREEVLGKNYLNLFLPGEIRNFVAEDIDKVLSGEPPPSFENEVMTKHRKIRTILWSVNRITDDNGEPVAVVASGLDVTNRKSMESKLKDSEKRFRAISRVLGHGVYVLNKEKKLMYINDEGERLLGWKKEELIGRRPHPIFHYMKIDGSPYPEQDCPVVQVIDSGQSYETESEAFVRKDGTIFPVAYTVTPLLDDGEVTGSVNVFEDISERKAAQEKIEKEKEFTASLIQGLSEGFTVLDSEGRLVSANKAFEQLTGFSQKELYGNKPPFKYWAEEDYPAIYDAFTKTMQGIESEYELTFKRKSGEKFTALISPRKTTDPDGNTMYFATIKDITERKRTLELVEREKEFTSNLIQGLTEGLVVLDEDGTLIRINDTLLQMTGFSRDELIGSKPPFKYWAQESASTIEDIFGRTRLGEQREFEVTFMKKNGEKFLVTVSPRKTTDPEGNTIFFSTIKDITDRKRSEEELKFRALLLDSASDSVFVLHPDGRFIYVNEAAYKSRGYTKDELMAMHLEDLDSPESFAKVPGRVKTLFEKGSITFEAEHKRKDGSFMPVEVSARLIEHKGEQVIISTTRDLTERNRTQEELARYKFFLDKASEDFYLVKFDGTLAYVNEAVAKSLGYSINELLNMKVQDIDERFDDELMRNHFNELRAKKVIELETIQVTKTGQRIEKAITTSYMKIGDEEFSVAFGRDITERKRAEAALRESEERFRAVIEQSVDGISMGTPDGRVIIYNKAMERISGYTMEEVNQHGWFNLTYPDEAERAIAVESAKKALTGRLPYTEVRITRKDGQKRWVSFKLTPITLAGNIYNLGITSDINDRKKSEQRLKENEEKYRKLIGLANDAIFIADAETGILIDANNKAAEMLGIPVNEIIGMHQSDLHPKEEAGRYQQIFMDAVKTGSVVTEELFIVRKDGTQVPVEISANITEVSGRKIVQGIFRDITERIAAEERLRLFSSAVDAAADGIQLTDMEGTLLYSNRSVENIFGYNPGEDKFVGEMNVDPDFAGKVIIPSVKNKGSWAGEVLVRHSDGHAFPIYLSTSVVAGRGGTPIALLGVLRDITQQKQIEQEQRRGKEFSDALNDMTAAMNSTLNINEILQQIAARSRKVMGSESAGIALRENGNWHIKYSCKLPPSLMGRFLTDNQARLAMIAAQSKQAVISNDSFNDPRVDHELMKENKIRSFMAVPLIVRDEVLGVLYFFNHTGPASFDNIQLDFANKLASSVSLNIENARLYHTERNIADTLQKSILTVPKTVPGIEFGYLYRSATETAMVGGDFYDIFELEHNKVGIIIGDVSGKGLNAATLTSLIKNTLKAYAYNNQDLSGILTKTNDVITKNSGKSIFATVFVGILDTRTGSLTYCNAGHPPPIVKTATSAIDQNPGSTFFLKNGNTAIGVFLDQHYDEKTHHLSPGDMLLLYTDGVIEARRGKELFTDSRLIDMVAKLTSTGIRDVPAEIYEEINRFASGKLVDDIAILSLTIK